ncbi:MAG: alpha/beta hydrolase [Nanoarchaeota archaeon]|nr:alpha/beta hydrolase [Nanoarchaeota archaeon]MBU1005313.1 alpha/beta hydrolase [Nanoarchaeota archaeon]MBU1946941.1 alpha/beta hydrolase [Nanoarchaeota archaeon]
MPKKPKKTNKFILVIFCITLLIFIFILGARLEKPIFSQGSLDNPGLKDRNKDTQHLIMEGTSDIEVLLVHGLAATSWETKSLAQYLNSKNITTYQVLLAGHDKSIYGLEQASFSEWYTALEANYNSIDKPKKFIIGLSVGSLAAIELTEKKQLDGLIIISTPIEFNDPLIKYAPLLQYFKRFSHRNIAKEHQLFYYENFPVKSLANMVSYINYIKKILPDVTSPVLIIQSKDDPRINYRSAYYIYSSLGSEKKEIMWLNSSTHVPIIKSSEDTEEIKNERIMVFEGIYSFILENS